MSEQNKLVVALIILLVVLVSMMFLNRYGGFTIMFNSFLGEPNTTQAEGSLQVAVDACKQEIRRAVGPNLQQMDVDGISTRYVSQRQSYLVFVDILVKGQERQPIYVECDVSAVTQTINRIRVNGPSQAFELF